MMCFGMVFFVSSIWGWLDIWVCNFPQIWKISSFISSNIFLPFLSLWDSSYKSVRPLNLIPQVTKVLVIFQSFFALCALFWIVSIAIAASLLIFSSAEFNLLLIPFSVIFFVFNLTFYCEIIVGSHEVERNNAERSLYPLFSFLQ